MRTKEQRITFHLNKITLLVERNNISTLDFNQIISGILPKNITKEVYNALRKHYKLLNDLTSK